MLNVHIAENIMIPLARATQWRDSGCLRDFTGTAITAARKWTERCEVFLRDLGNEHC